MPLPINFHYLRSWPPLTHGGRQLRPPHLSTRSPNEVTSRRRDVHCTFATRGPLFCDLLTVDSASDVARPLPLLLAASVSYVDVLRPVALVAAQLRGEKGEQRAEITGALYIGTIIAHTFCFTDIPRPCHEGSSVSVAENLALL
ncbi:hypothetical protein EVAR_45319_1 [Eumeta japonica]|uniref:Uncharacterized protein n=1 Tax=Eumeta variegata TaxID=151549 RepID=A0A4C1XKF9_EUMVA|nr:hypothetical protein EVAR_45319_1 [Eumeta japonica]